MKPALTPEEWAGQYRTGYGEGTFEITKSVGLSGVHESIFVNDISGYASLPGDFRHGIAALCLHNQPFGFTWDDVDILLGYACTCKFNTEAQHKADLADRIASLLPPRKP